MPDPSDRDVINALKDRRSIREYRNEMVPDDVLAKILEAARWAPSGANIQPWRFIVVTDPHLRREIGKVAKYFFIKSHHVGEAPVLIVLCGDTKKSQWHTVDCSLAGANVMIAAHVLGLGTCWIGAFDEAKVKELLDIPDQVKVEGIITLGYPAGKSKAPPRLALDEVVSLNTWHGPRAGAIRTWTHSGPTSVLPKVARIVTKPLRDRVKKRRK